MAAPTQHFPPPVPAKGEIPADFSVCRHRPHLNSLPPSSSTLKKALLTRLLDVQKERREVPKRLRGCGNCCCANLPCRGKRPHHYLPPRWEYIPSVPGVSNPVFWHRDYDRRESSHRMTDRYLHHHDGKLRTLIIACSDDVWDTSVSRRSGATWRRTYVRKMAPYKVRIASWVIDYSKSRSCGWYCVELLKSIPAMGAMMTVVGLNAPRVTMLLKFTDATLFI
jgi:hypothetical protein